MRHTRRLRRVKAIEIKTDVERPFKSGNMLRREVQHRKYFNAITLRLFAAVAVQRPDTNLNNALCVPRFQYAGKWRCMAARIAFKIGINVGVRIKMQNVERTMTRRQSRHHRICYRMIAAQQQRNRPRVHRVNHRLYDERVISRGIDIQKRHIAAIYQGNVSSYFKATLGR